MRTSIPTALLATAAMTFAPPARAQGFYWTFAYEPAAPLGGIRTATREVSFAGLALGAKYLFNKQWSLGLSGHWNQFAHNYASATYAIADGSFTGSIYRQVWTGTVLADAQFYLAPDAAINPYLGLGGGVTWMSNEVLVSDLTFEESGRGIAVSPEAGLLIAFDRDAFDPDLFAMQSILVGVRGTFSPASARDVSDASFVGVTVGFFVY
jgi:opacity protein-like surface antigen